jgi:hypothetical protein
VTALILEDEALLLASPTRVDVIATTMSKYIFPLDRVAVQRKPVAGVFALLLADAAAAAALVVGDDAGGAGLPPLGQCALLRGGKLLSWGGTGLALPGWMVVALEAEGAKALMEAAGREGVRVAGMAEWEVSASVCRPVGRFVGRGVCGMGWGGVAWLGDSCLSSFVYTFGVCGCVGGRGDGRSTHANTYTHTPTPTNHTHANTFNTTTNRRSGSRRAGPSQTES